MRERTQRRVELGFAKKPAGIIKKIEKMAEKMRVEGWFFLHSDIDADLKEVVLTFEREIAN